MIDFPEEIKQIFLSDSRIKKTFYLDFFNDSAYPLYPSENIYPTNDLFPSEVNEYFMRVTNNQIVSESLVIKDTLCDSEDIEFGACESTSVEIILADINRELTGTWFELSMQIEEYRIPLGIYKVQSFVRQSDRRKRKIVAYDRMRLFDVDISQWWNEIEFPISIKDLRDSLCKYVGVRQQQTALVFDDMMISKTIDIAEMSGLDVIKAICEINGCFGHFDRTGRFEYITLQKNGLYPQETLHPNDILYPSEPLNIEVIDKYKQPIVYEDYIVQGITAVNIRQQKGDIGATYGNEGNVYVIEGNFLVFGKSADELSAIAEKLYLEISGIVYRPSQIEFPFRPWLEIGDIIRIPTKDDFIETYCMNRTISGCQAMTDSFESTGTPVSDEVFGVNKQIIQLEGKMAIIVAIVEEVSYTLTDLSKFAEAQFKITSDEISAEVTRAKGEEEKLSGQFKVVSDEITLVVEQADKDLRSEITQQAGLIELKVSSGEVSSSISLEDGAVNITGDRLSWTSTNSSMTTDGTLTCQNINATNGTFSGTITGSTVTGGTISGSAITGTTISGGTIEGAEISGGTIKGSDIEAGNITATGTIAIGVLSGDTIDADVQLNTHTCTCNYLYYGMASQYSDRRLKDNIVSIDKDTALEVVSRLNPVAFNYTDSDIDNIGFIAQEVKEIEETLGIDWGLYGTMDDGYYCISYMNYVPILTASIQKLEEEVKRLEAMQ